MRECRRTALRLFADRDALLFDTGAWELLPLIEQLRNQGFVLRGLVLSHRHIAGAGGAVPMIRANTVCLCFCILSTPGIHKPWLRALSTKTPLDTR